MALSINSNLTALNSQAQLRQTEQAKRQVLAQLASGKAVNGAADNAAGLAIAEALRSQVAGDSQAIRNAIDGISLTQTADGALSQLTQNSQRIEELAVQAGNGTLSASDREALQKEVDQLTQANSQIIQSTNYNSTALFNGGSNTTFQVGANSSSDAQISVTAPNLTSGSTALNGYNANANATGTIDLSNPSAALSQIQADLKQLGNSRADLGAASNRFGTAIDNLTTSSINAEASRSRIQDADYAAASAELARQQILSNSSVAVQAQANLTPQYAASLLR
ncbi:MAG: flagellin [Vogesella sp.]|uniref:flagellin N-terminal helical domain-containing protein n=1 Tax=Vogesella sp. TaxID=1904252 RepID=UPI003918F678